MVQLQELAPALSNLLLVAITVGLLGYWIYAVATYDWSKFEEDSKGDDFLKPYDDKTV
jgi:hypothetical protein